MEFLLMVAQERLEKYSAQEKEAALKILDKPMLPKSVARPSSATQTQDVTPVQKKGKVNEK
jgi:hypothetical protein